LGSISFRGAIASATFPRYENKSLLTVAARLRMSQGMKAPGLRMSQTQYAARVRMREAVNVDFKYPYRVRPYLFQPN
jgi:hypothetical protein